MTDSKRPSVTNHEYDTAFQFTEPRNDGNSAPVIGDTPGSYSLRGAAFIQEVEDEPSRFERVGPGLLKGITRRLKTKQDSGCRKVSSQISENAKERMEVLEMECHMSSQAKYVEMEDLRKQEESRQLRFKDMESKNTKLLQALRYIGADRILEAYNWLQEHRNELKKEVYGPVLIESFITQDTDDRDFLLQNLRPFDVPILNYLGDSSGDRISFQISGEIKEQMRYQNSEFLIYGLQKIIIDGLFLDMVVIFLPVLKQCSVHDSLCSVQMLVT
ncbi:hypothetical protein J5N97_017596 [Dioscorea zingiberensis]|uniref:Uncharacterized protein n=1 Tax=Dioscorea zingiberensis TaxID=325984 RepID=A0A9D5HGC7_9LILI|nr:hypothetical protein J5N97_017596 [Dioscorea zingiberensis]